LESLLSFWKGKVFVLVLLGFVATARIITITLSAADATAHVVENPFAPAFLHGQEIAITLLLAAVLGAVFLKGFKEAIGIAVVLVGIYLSLNLIVVGVGLYKIVTQPQTIVTWRNQLFANYGNPLAMIGVALLLFPKLALGLSGFETGVVVMPLVQGNPDDDPKRPMGRILNTHKLLTWAALIMSVFLISSSIVTIMLIPAEAFEEGGEASGRALAYLAHTHLGDLFGTLYDLSTISILWFAGSSAMAGLLNIVPRYLPRYGMAPEWARATRPLVLVFTAINFIVIIGFRAEVEAQAGAYATGVLVLMTSAVVAVTLSTRREGARRAAFLFGVVTVVFLYATAANIIGRPEGLFIALIFIVGIIVTSLISRALRSTELRTERVEFDETARRFILEAAERGELRFIANRRDAGDVYEYRHKEKEQRADNHIPSRDPVIFLEVEVADASEFTDVVEVKGVQVDRFRILHAVSSSVPNALAAVLLAVRDMTGKCPHAYFGWREGNPFKYLFRFIIFGEGDIAPVTHEVLRKAERDPERRPAIHVGG
ncbi:MAG TPA: hypothetical protein VER55_15710, partial [Ardenticatenaceae bacterium]|nr:hypothetical protein [Ardenticatenaceae bacterium]